MERAFGKFQMHLSALVTGGTFILTMVWKDGVIGKCDNHGWKFIILKFHYARSWFPYSIWYLNTDILFAQGFLKICYVCFSCEFNFQARISHFQKLYIQLWKSFSNLQKYVRIKKFMGCSYVKCITSCWHFEFLYMWNT